jgi:hypothetical protein
MLAKQWCWWSDHHFGGETIDAGGLTVTLGGV